MKISNNWWDADGKTIYNLKRAVYYDEAVTKGQTTKGQISQTKGWLKQLASTDNEKQIIFFRLWKQRSLWLRCSQQNMSILKASISINQAASIW